MMNPISKGLLCGCLVDVPIEQIPQFLHYPGADMVEWRLDFYMQKHSMEEALDAFRFLRDSRRHPIVVANRPTREGGVFEGKEESRIEVLRKAVEAGAEWVDLEVDVSRAGLEWFQSAPVRTVLSHHEFSGTPHRSRLRRLAKKMARMKPDVIKIITTATTPEDNLRVLDLIPFGRDELGIDVISFCMGPLGKWSRLVCLLLGSPWTYVQFPGHSPSAPGQFTVSEMRGLLDSGQWAMGW